MSLLDLVLPVRCVVCGAPFATKAMIDRIGQKLTGHWMYAGARQRRTLEMCGTCRAADNLSAKETLR